MAHLTDTERAAAETYGGLTIVRLPGTRGPEVKIWTGKAQRADWIRFQSEERREKFIIDRKTSWDAAAAYKAERAAARKAVQASDFYTPGSFVEYSWGWEQTNPEFYRVESLSGKTVTLQRVHNRHHHGNSDMSDYVVPGGATKDAPFTKRVGGGGAIRFKFGHGFPWNGNPTYRSWYA